MRAVVNGLAALALALGAVLTAGASCAAADETGNWHKEMNVINNGNADSVNQGHAATFNQNSSRYEETMKTPDTFSESADQQP